MWVTGRDLSFLGGLRIGRTPFSILCCSTGAMPYFFHSIGDLGDFLSARALLDGGNTNSASVLRFSLFVGGDLTWTGP